MSAIDRLRQFSHTLTDLHNVMALLHWDQEVTMPPAGVDGRASQAALLSTIIHQKTISGELGDLLQEVDDVADALSLADNALLRVMHREYEQNIKLPEEFVADFSRLTSQALPVWVKARRQSDFRVFQPVLEKIVRMCRQKAAYLGYGAEPYDALLDLYEEGLVTAEVGRIFTELALPLMEVLQAGSRPAGRRLFIEKEFSPDRQAEFSRRILKKIGYDFERGRQDQSAHPFSTSLGHNDRRITNRFHPRSLEFIFSALHEGGHALYEQGIAGQLAQTHLDSGVSLGIHESQSRLWENIIGRSPEFWEHFYPELCDFFPEQFRNVPLDVFLAEINSIRPGFIRVEADEVSYNLHVLIRFELERALIDGSVGVAELPELWNRKYHDYLGVTVEAEPDADAKGVLQDIHWAHGSFGYFPTYTIGNLAAAQIWQKYRTFDPQHQQTLASGDLHKIRTWLTDHIYRHGAIYPPQTLLKNVTGEKLAAASFVSYLRQKYMAGGQPG